MQLPCCFKKDIGQIKMVNHSNQKRYNCNAQDFVFPFNVVLALFAKFIHLSIMLIKGCICCSLTKLKLLVKVVFGIFVVMSNIAY